MGKNDGAIAMMLLFGAAVLWNNRTGLADAILSPLKNYKGRYPSSGYTRVMGGPQGFQRIGVVDDVQSMTHTPDPPKSGYLDRKTARRSIYNPKPKAATQGFTGATSSKVGTTSAKATPKAKSFTGVSAKRIYRVPVRRRDPVLTIPSGTTQGYSSVGHDEPLK